MGLVVLHLIVSEVCLFHPLVVEHAIDLSGHKHIANASVLCVLDLRSLLYPSSETDVYFDKTKEDV